MEPTLIGWIAVILLITLTLLGIPIGYVLTGLGFIGLIFLMGIKGALGFMATSPYSTTANFNWTCVPMFILMGHFAYRGGFMADFYVAAHRWLGRLPGGLCIATTTACAGMGAVSGSSLAVAGTMGRIALPEMLSLGYSRSLSGGCVAYSGTLGSLIPPSLVMVVYGIMTETSIGKLFLAGFIPGILSAVGFMVLVFIRVSLNPSLAPLAPHTSWREKFGCLWRVAGILSLAIIVLGGIFLGLFTPIEGAAAGALAALLMGVIRGTITWEGFWEALVETVHTTCALFIIVIGSFIFASFIALSRIPQNLCDFIGTLGISPFSTFVAIGVLYLFLGCILDTMGMILVSLPIIFPITQAVGFDPIWFGILLVKFCEMGMVTPPVGMNVYVVHAVAPQIPLGDLFRGIVPFLLVDIVNTLLIYAFPVISLWLPRMMS